MNRSLLAATTPRSFALRNLDTKAQAVEPGRFSDLTAATMKAIKMRTGTRSQPGDGMVREVVGIDAKGNAWTIKLVSGFVTAANPTGYVLDKPISAPKAARGAKPVARRGVRLDFTR